MHGRAAGVIVVAIGLAAALGCGGQVRQFPNYRVKDHASDAEYLVRGVPRLSSDGELSFKLGRSDEWVTLQDYSMELLNRREYFWGGRGRPPPWGVPASEEAETDFGLRTAGTEPTVGN